MKKKVKYLEELKAIAPSIAISVSREVDSRFSWDGDGPDPRDEGCSPYDVIVMARAIVNGELVEGSACLGGSYYKPDEPCGDVHGYLPQMLEEALRDCPIGETTASALNIEREKAIDRMTVVMRELYENKRAA